MKTIKTTDAAGHILCHDLTRIVPDEFKGVQFKKGHIIKEEDIPMLLSMGKENLYVWENGTDTLHENEGAEKLKKIAAEESFDFSEAKEGKINLTAKYDGLLKVDSDKLLELNCLGELVCSTMLNNSLVKKGDTVAAIKIIPLVISLEKIEKAEKLADEKIIKIMKIPKKRIGIVTTGNEIYKGRIKDAFGPVLKNKMEAFEAEIIGQVFCDDDTAMIKSAIEEFEKKGAHMILCTGGMSVDPDDVTPVSVREYADEIVTYGSPVLPGAMFLLAYKNKNGRKIPVLGLPGCVMYAKTTVFDLLLPRILCDEILSLKDIAKLGHGGLCASCEVCHYPNCCFGKG